MDSGQIIYIISRLTLGAVAAFLAILLWVKTRDLPWMLMIIGILAAYGETVYSILGLLGFTWGKSFAIGSMPVISIVFSCLPAGFIIAAFGVMVFRKYRRP